MRYTCCYACWFWFWCKHWHWCARNTRNDCCNADRTCRELPPRLRSAATLPLLLRLRLRLLLRLRQAPLNLLRAVPLARLLCCRELAIRS